LDGKYLAEWTMFRCKNVNRGKVVDRPTKIERMKDEKPLSA